MRHIPILLLLASLASAKVAVLPAPQFFEPVPQRIVLGKTAKVEIVLNNPLEPQMQLAAESLRKELVAAAPALDVRTTTGAASPSLRIQLWDLSRDPNPPVRLTPLDRAALSAQDHYGQGYVMMAPDAKSIWILGASPQAVLYGAMSAVQLIEKTAEGATVQGAYIRDYPDFEFRAASDWLLNIEVNGWTWDRGQGVEAFAKLVESKLDRALRYKINMALVDGFGFSVSKRPAFYAPLMRRLNQYARARGIHLIFGGYGASYGMAYEPVVMYEQGAGFKGTVFENRRSYPNGETYRCMGFPHARKGYDPAVLGSCRSNEALNHMKAEELREYVKAVEPGALYIHHEDFGGFEGTEKAWKDRCEQCRRRWPNDSLAAMDGGAGGLAHGYSELAKAVSSVRNPETGFDGSRDTKPGPPTCLGPTMMR